MKPIALTLTLTLAALAQQPLGYDYGYCPLATPTKLYIEIHPETPRVTAGILKRCSKIVTVTNQRKGVQYFLEPGLTLGTNGALEYTGVLFNTAGEAIAAFKTKTPEQLGTQTCQYLEAQLPNKEGK